MKALVALSGNGVYDGSEIHESVLTLLHLNMQGIEYQCVAPNIKQYHVINHTNGEEMKESRNVLVEAARIARGDIKDLSEVSIADYDALILPGGFGAAKNFTTWAFDGPKGSVLKEIKTIILDTVKLKKPILAKCMAPVVIAKSLEGSTISAKLTVGSDKEATPYEIEAISAGMESIGARAEKVSVRELTVDTVHKIITTPCYMMEASISEISEGIAKAVSALKLML